MAKPKPTAADQERLRKIAGDAAQATLAVLIALARSGDVSAAKAVLSKTMPDVRPTYPPVKFKMPEGDDTDLVAAAWAILKEVSTGAMPPDVGASLIASLGTVAKLVEHVDFEKRLAALEAGGQQ